MNDHVFCHILVTNLRSNQMRLILSANDGCRHLPPRTRIAQACESTGKHWVCESKGSQILYPP